MGASVRVSAHEEHAQAVDPREEWRWEGWTMLLGRIAHHAEQAQEEAPTAAVREHHARPRTGHDTHAVPTHGHNGHGAGHAGYDEARFRRPFWVSLVLTLPILVYTEVVQQILGFRAPAVPGAAWIAPVLGSVIYWYCGWLRSASCCRPRSARR
jgi:Cu2+-exporting ATPase